MTGLADHSENGRMGRRAVMESPVGEATRLSLSELDRQMEIAHRGVRTGFWILDIMYWGKFLTYRKYIRLFMVLAIPLLLAGIVTFRVLLPYDQTAYILCEPGFFDRHENCRYMGPSTDGLYQTVKKDYPTWVDVSVGEWKKTYPQNIVEASSRTVRGAQVIAATPFALQGDDAARAMKSLVGMHAIVQLGIPDNERSIVAGDIASLYCNDFNFLDEVGLYSASCYGSGWGGPVQFRVTGPDDDKLQNLLHSLSDEINSQANSYTIYQIIMYPLFIYLFLIISALAWLLVKAVRFVKND